MRHQHLKGFTIIETMLFLAITGLLLAGILIGSGVAIGIERYRDAATSLQVEIQQLYADTISVHNERDGNQACNAGGITSAVSSRGQGECIMLGRYMTINSDGLIETMDIVGYPTSGVTGGDIAVLSSYALFGFRETTNSFSMEWDTRIAWPARGTSSQSPTMPRAIAIMTLRSPQSGFVYTFTRDNPSTDTIPNTTTLREMVVESRTVGDPNYGRDERIICVEPNGLVPGSRQAIRIGARASNATAISKVTNEMLTQQQGTGATQC